MNIDNPISVILAQKSPSLWTISPDTLVIDAIRMMADKDVGAVPVVDGEKLVGLISERDYTRNIVLKGRSSRDTPVRDIMAKELVVVAPGDCVADCMRRMTHKRIRHLPVIENDRLIGIISIGDLVNYTINAQGAALDQLEKFITGEYPA